MDTRELIVAIVVPIKGSKETSIVGTGCLISGEMILTARHIFDDYEWQRDGPIRIYWNAGLNTPLEDLECQPLDKDFLVWRGRDQLDAVLIRCPGPDNLHVLTDKLFSSRSHDDERRWISRGYPKAAIPSAPLAPADFSGGFFPPLKADQLATVTSDHGPENMDDWAGTSGMPILSDGQILGIVKEVPDNFGADKAYAVPMVRLLANEEFKKCVLPERHDATAYRRSMKNEIANILKSSSEVCHALFNQIGTLDGFDQDEAVASWILDAEPGDWLDKLSQARKTLTRGLPDRHYSVIRRLLEFTLPALNDERVVAAAQQIFDGAEGAIVQLNISSRTVAELVMARADGAEARFLSDLSTDKYGQIDEEDVPGCFALQVNPESGPDPLGQQQVTDMVTQLEGRLCSVIEHRFLTGETLERMRGTKPEKRIVHINNRLEREYTNFGRRYYFAILLSDNESIWVDAINRLKKEFPAVVFLELSDDIDLFIGEMKDYGQVPYIITSKGGDK